MKKEYEQAWKVLKATVLASAVLCAASCASLQSHSSAAEQHILLRNVTVIPMDRPGLVPAQDVLIAGTRITAIRPTSSLRSPSGHVIDGTGKFVMPGLWDMHTHALSGGSVSAREALSLYLSNGVVGVRDLGSTLEDLAAARRELPLGTDLPQVIASGPLLDGPKGPWQQKMALGLNNVDDARAAAEQLADAGVDFLKIYNNLSEEQFAAIAQVAKQRGLPMAGHVPFNVSLEAVSAGGQKSIEHAGLQLVKDCIPEGLKATPAVLSAWIKTGYPGKYKETSRWWAMREEPACIALYQRMVSRGTWVTPTLTNEIQGGSWVNDYDLSVLAAERLASCISNLESVNAEPVVRDAADQDIFSLVLQLHKVGVPLLAGSDTPNSCLSFGSSLHKELEMLRHAGLSTWEALKTATLNPARFLGRTDEGMVRKGAVANLLLLNENPLAEITNTRKIAGVMLNGRWFEKGRLSKRANHTSDVPEQ